MHEHDSRNRAIDIVREGKLPVDLTRTSRIAAQNLINEAVVARLHWHLDAAMGRTSRQCTRKQYCNPNPHHAWD